MAGGFALCTAAALSAGGANASSSPQDAAQAFLDWHAQPRAHSDYDRSEVSQLKQLFTGELLCLLQATERYRAHFESAAPGDKPPYADGDFFLSSAWEHPVSAEIELLTVRDSSATALVLFVDSYGTRWRDRLRLRLDGSDWRLADVDRLSLFTDAQGKVSAGTPDSLVQSFYRDMGRNRPEVRWRRVEVDACRVER